LRLPSNKASPKPPSPAGTLCSFRKEHPKQSFASSAMPRAQRWVRPRSLNASKALASARFHRSSERQNTWPNGCPQKSKNGLAQSGPAVCRWSEEIPRPCGRLDAMFCDAVKGRGESDAISGPRGCQTPPSCFHSVSERPGSSPVPPLSLTRLHSLGIDYSTGVRRAEKIEEGLRCLGILCPRDQKGMDDSRRHDA
jgi:hypothetical protein